MCIHMHATQQGHIEGIVNLGGASAASRSVGSNILEQIINKSLSRLPYAPLHNIARICQNVKP
jgi:hypothetical protein